MPASFIHTGHGESAAQQPKPEALRLVLTHPVIASLLSFPVVNQQLPLPRHLQECGLRPGYSVTSLQVPSVAVPPSTPLHPLSTKHGRNHLGCYADPSAHGLTV